MGGSGVGGEGEGVIIGVGGGGGVLVGEGEGEDFGLPVRRFTLKADLERAGMAPVATSASGMALEQSCCPIAVVLPGPYMYRV